MMFNWLDNLLSKPKCFFIMSTFSFFFRMEILLFADSDFDEENKENRIEFYYILNYKKIVWYNLIT